MVTFLNFRPAALAGSFYPATRKDLVGVLGACLKAARKPADSTGPQRPRLRALVVPHAGYSYSGTVAARAYLQVTDWSQIPRIHLWGPAHRIPFSGLAGGPYLSWNTPLGSLGADWETLKALEEGKTLRNWELPHRDEHSLEVQLPFLQHLGFGGTLVPLLFGEVDPREAAVPLSGMLRTDDLIVVSTDLSHFHPYGEAVKRDTGLLDAVLRLDVPGVLSGEACGRSPLTALLEIARIRGWVPVLLEYRNSGDVCGDRQRVVGYGAVAFWEGEL